MAESPWLPRGRCGGVLRPGTRQETFPTRRKNKGSGTMVSSSTAGLLKSGSCFVLQNKNPQSNQELLPLKRWSCFTQVLWGSWRQTLAPQKFLVGSVGEEEQPFIGLPSRPVDQKNIVKSEVLASVLSTAVFRQQQRLTVFSPSRSSY